MSKLTIFMSAAATALAGGYAALPAPATAQAAPNIAEKVVEARTGEPVPA